MYRPVECDAIIMDQSKIKAIPQLVAEDTNAVLTHEAAIGKIAGEQLIKLMSLGLTEQQAIDTIIEGFCVNSFNFWAGEAMNLNLLKTYVKVVETQNLSRTADEFGLSQPAVTKQIQSLEDMFGVLLLERSGRRLKTTEAGETLYHCAREVIKAMDKTEKAMEEIADGRKGTLYIGASTIPGQYILPRLLKDFKDHYPSITLSMEIADTEKVINLVADRVLDLGIVGGWMNVRKIEGFQWLEDELVVVVPARTQAGWLSTGSPCRTWFMSAGYLEKRGPEPEKRLRKCSCPVA